MSNIPKLFIGSASETLAIAEALESELLNVAKTEIWNNALRPNYYTLDELSRKTSEADFAVFILGQEDRTDSRGKIEPSPRDNVIYEAGLFAGKLGVARVFLLVDARGTRIPSDWQGLNYLTFNPEENRTSDVVHPAAVKIRQAITEWNAKKAVSPEQRISGHWWQFVLNTDADAVVSLMMIDYSELALKWKICGTSWTKDGTEIAKYWSRAAVLDPGDLNLFYYWKGNHPFDESIPEFFGVGEIQFNDQGTGSISAADGWFSNSPLKKLNDTIKKSTTYVRATESDIEIVNKKSDIFALKDLISLRISEWRSKRSVTRDMHDSGY